MDKKEKRMVYALILSLMLLSFSTGAISQTRTMPPKPGELGSESNPLKIGTVHVLPYLPSFKIHEFLKTDYGIKVELVEISSSTERALAMLAGKTHINYAGPSSAALLRSKGQPLALICNAGTLANVLVVQADSNIKSPSDLKGKKIGTELNSIMHMQLLGFLKAHNLEVGKDVEIVQVRYPDHTKVIEKKQLDAVATAEPYPSYLIVRGFGKPLDYLTAYEPGWKSISGGLNTTEKFAKESPHLVQAVVTANVKAMKYYSENTKQMIDDSMKMFGYSDDWRPIIQAGYHNTAFRYAIEESEFESVGKFWVALGRTDKVPNPKDWIIHDFYKKAALEANWKEPEGKTPILLPPAWDPSYKYPMVK